MLEVRARTVPAIRAHDGAGVDSVGVSQDRRDAQLDMAAEAEPVRRAGRHRHFVPPGSPALPRYEIWPHQYAAKCYPFMYEARWQDLNDTGAALPRYIRGDVLVEGALWQCAMWPGPTATQPNPYFNLTLAKMHQDNFTKAMYELERQDDELNDQIVQYTNYLNLPWAPIPFADSRFLQSHSF
jgi:hypothetical protein